MGISFAKLGNYGQLGNAMFQLACSYALARRNNDKCLIPQWKYTQYFNFDEHVIISNNINYKHEYNEPYYAYKEIQYKPNMNLMGYFQSYKYFNDFEDDIRKMLTPKFNLQKNHEIASIHVRRTDYLKFPNHHPVCSMDYYNLAMEISGYNYFMVFSDDINWCKQNFKGSNFEFTHNHECFDLELMSTCGAHIIANSSYSWWAAWLNHDKNKKVIAPREWFGPALASTHPIDDLILPEWILL